MNIYVVGMSHGYANWLRNYHIVDNIKQADIVLFTGGEDVSPSLYGEMTGSRTHTNRNRDKREYEVFEEAFLAKKKMLGICRGSQLLCALSGGRLVQHQDNPHSVHPITTSDGKTISITSTHHQAQYPYELSSNKYKLLAWTDGISKIHLNGMDKEISDEPFREAEIVYYPHTRCLGIQGHPEMMWEQRYDYPETFTYLHELIDNFLNDKL